MMNLGNALAAGYSTFQMLDFLASNYPNLKKKISQAQSLGYDINDIVKSLSGFSPEDLERFESNGVFEKNNPWIDAEKTQRKRSADQTIKKYAPAALGVIAPLAAYGIYRGMQSAGSLSQAIPNTPPINPPPTTPPAGMAAGSQNVTAPTPSPIMNPPAGLPQSPGQMATPQTPTPGPMIGQQISDQATNPVEQALQPAAAETPVPPPQTNLPKIFDQLTQNINPDELSKTQKDQLQFLKQASDKLELEGKMGEPGVRTLSNRINKILQGQPGTVIEESARAGIPFQPEEQKQIPKEIAPQEQPTEITPVPITAENKQQIKKGDDVITQDGNVATVKGIQGDRFLIEEDGKARLVPFEELRGQPEAIEKAKIVLDTSKIEEAGKSAALAFSIPMPDRSSIINMFHDGSLYLYKRKDGKPIDESIVRRIIDGTDIPMTTGKTFLGGWDPTKGDSRGSANYKELVKLAQPYEDMQSNDDPEKPLYFEKITDSYAHANYKEVMRLFNEARKLYSAKAKKAKKTTKK